jgi:hypothetical protein
MLNNIPSCDQIIFCFSTRAMDGYLGHFRLWAIVNNTSMTMGALILKHTQFSVLWGTGWEVALLGHVRNHSLTSTWLLPRRRLQEEDQQFRTSSLPAIPNPFPELCGPGSPPVLTPGSFPPSQAAPKQVSVLLTATLAIGCGVCTEVLAWYFAEKGGRGDCDLFFGFLSYCFSLLSYKAF